MKKITSLFIATFIAFSISLPAKAEVVETSAFADIGTKSSFYEDLYTLYLKEVFMSDNNQNIHPDQKVTRADASFMIYEILGLTLEQGKQFSDVSPSLPEYDAIQTLSAKGVLDGFPDGSFRPNDILTRAQMAKIIASSFEYEIDQNAETQFTDVAKNFVPYVEALQSRKVAYGYSPTQFKPIKQINRQEMAAFLNRAYKQVPGTEYNDYEVMNAVNESVRRVQFYLLDALNANPTESKRKVSDVAEGLSKSTAEPYKTKATNGYLGSCIACDSPNVPDVPDYALGFDIQKLTNDAIIVDTVTPTRGGVSGARVNIELRRDGDVWKMKRFDGRSFAEDPLNFTVEQAQQYAEYKIPIYYQEEVKSIQLEGMYNDHIAMFKINNDFVVSFDLNTAEIELMP